MVYHLDTIKKSQVGKDESEITLLTIYCVKVRHDLPLPYPPIHDRLPPKASLCKLYALFCNEG